MASCLSLGVLNEIKVIDLNRTSVSIPDDGADNLIFAGGIKKISQAFMNFHSRNLEDINISSVSTFTIRL